MLVNVEVVIVCLGANIFNVNKGASDYFNSYTDQQKSCSLKKVPLEDVNLHIPVQWVS